MSAIGLTDFIVNQLRISSSLSNNWKRKGKRIRLALNRLLKFFCFCGCMFSSFVLLIIYFKYEINTSSEVIELDHIPIEAMDIKCYIHTQHENDETHDVLMHEFIKTFDDYYYRNLT